MAKDPIRPTDDEARVTARNILTSARSGALGVMLDGRPFVSRILVSASDGQPLTLISDLSAHTSALRDSPEASILLGEPGDKGDPLIHPRVTLRVTATFLEKDRADHGRARERILTTHPKSKLYIDFGDFHIVRLEVEDAFLNAGFGKAYRLSATDLLSQ